MAPAAPLYDCLPNPDNASPDTILEGFLRYAQATGLTLYPHQEEAILALLAGKNVILHTPTGSGKSLVATAMIFLAMAWGGGPSTRAPSKALVSEKFFAFCGEFGPDKVGMMTGDATVNRDAPVICCTAEILRTWRFAGGPNATSIT